MFYGDSNQLFDDLRRGSMLRQVNDFALACNDEATAKELYKQIGSRLQLLNETEDPFTYLGLITDFNAIDVEQSQE